MVVVVARGFNLDLDTVKKYDRSASEGHERVLCLDELTGKELWKHEYRVTYTISYPSGPRCTPTVDGEHVYTLGAEGHLVCLRVRDGTVEWSKDLKHEYKTKSALWGYASHPLIDGDRLVCVVGTQAEVNSVQKTAEGTYVITEAGPNPRLLELDAAGGIVNEFALNCQKANAHMQSRMARKQTDGTFLVPHLLDFAVVRYDRKGKEISRFDTHVTGEPAVNSWPFTAIALADGGILVGLTNGNRVIEFDPQGKVRWQITSDDVGGIINDACGVQRLPSGNTMITSYHIGQGGVRLLEITPEKKLVWTWKADVPAVHHFQVLAIDGKALENSSLR